MESTIELIYNVRLRMTLCKTVHAESFLVQSKDTLKTTRNYQQNLRINFHKKKMNFRTRLCSGVNQLSHLKNYVQRAKITSGTRNNRKIPPENKNGENHLLGAKQTQRESFILHYFNNILYTRPQISTRIARRFESGWRIEFYIEKHSDSMQISGQKSLSRTFPTVQEPRQAKQNLTIY